MSKLDGNERWNSKMLMHEHVSQYDQRNGSNRSKATPEELTMIRDTILLPHLLTMVQRNRDEIARSSMMLKKLYLTATDLLLDRISKDIHKLKRELTTRSIKIYDGEQENDVYYYQYKCRGYMDRFGITRDLMRSQISIVLGKYLTDIMKVS